MVVTGLATPAGDLYNGEKAPKAQSSGKVYTGLFVRQWDAYVTENTNSIWYTTLKKSKGILEKRISPLKNALRGHSVRLESPVPPFGGSGDFDISKNGLVFIAKDPKLDPANYTKTDVYYIPLKTFTEEQAPSPQIIKTGNLEGYSNSVVFSPDANSVAFTRMKRYVICSPFLYNHISLDLLRTSESHASRMALLLSPVYANWVFADFATPTLVVNTRATSRDYSSYLTSRISLMFKNFMRRRMVKVVGI